MTEETRRFEFQTEQDIRIDKYLAGQLPDISRSQIKGLMDAGKVMVDGEIITKAGTKLKQGNVILM